MLDIDLYLNARWRGGELDRLLDAAHAELQSAVSSLLTQAGWLVRAEVTFSRFGERGSIDLLAFRPTSRTLLVIEIKSVIADIQGLLRPLDTKVRLSREIAAELGWRAATVVPCLVVHDNATARRRVNQHAPLFARFDLRGWDARRWIRAVDTSPSGLLLFVNPPNGHETSAMRAGRQRVRRSKVRLRSADQPGSV